MPKDDQRTLQELEGINWGEATFQSYLVTTVHRLRRKPLGEFTVEDLRIMIGQQIGLDRLVPRALAVLCENPVAEGDFYPGDLLKSLVEVDAAFWGKNPRHFKEAREVARKALELTTGEYGLEEDIADFLAAPPGTSNPATPAEVYQRWKASAASAPLGQTLPRPADTRKPQPRRRPPPRKRPPN